MIETSIARARALLWQAKSVGRAASPLTTGTGRLRLLVYWGVVWRTAITLCIRSREGVCAGCMPGVGQRRLEKGVWGWLRGLG